METLEVLNTRRSCRKYLPKTVETEKVEKILEAGRFAATGMGKQSPIIIDVKNREVRDQLSSINAEIMGKEKGFDPFYGAPEVLVVLASKSIGTHVYDGSLVMGNMMNAAWDLGVSSCWIHRAKETFETEYGKNLLKSLDIDPEAFEGIGNLVIGYADGEPAPRVPRKDHYVYTVC